MRAAAEEDGVEVEGRRRNGAAACFVWLVEAVGRLFDESKVSAAGRFADDGGASGAC